MKILIQLSKNAAIERRFKDAGHFFWLLAVESLKLVKQTERRTEDDSNYLKKFDEYFILAELYIAFDKVVDYIEQPFKRKNLDTNAKLQIFNACKFLISHLEKKPSLAVLNASISPPIYARQK